MAFDKKYGQISINGIPMDEPVFVIRAKDVLALPTIQHYKVLRQNAGVDVEVLEEWLDDLDEVMGRFGEWAQGNVDQMKLPD